VKTMRTFWTASLFGLMAVACTPPPDAKVNPTWADAEPILRAQCNYCHGSTSAVTAAVGPAVYRLDFFDLQSCGDAALAMNAPSLARGSAGLFKGALETPPTGDRPRMPPAPAVELEDWQRDTLLAWSKNPVKGPPPADNHPPFMKVQKLPTQADQLVAFTAVVDDADGHAVVGVVRVGNTIFRMDRPGSFAVKMDSSGWAEGTQRISATLCDGWVQSNFDLGDLQISHRR